MTASFRFLHIADAHIGGRFAGLSRRSEAAASEMARACLDALDRAVDVALERSAAFVIIAGDLFDQNAPDLRESFETAKRLARLWRAGVDVYWLLGNHDYGAAAQALPSSERLHRFSTKKVQTFERPDLGVALHGRSFPERAAPENFAAKYPRAKTGRFEIGVLHTSLDGSRAASTYAPCAIGDLAATGYDYWALGHVHAHDVISSEPHIVFPGCLQGRSPREAGAKGCMLVTVEDGVVIEIERVICDGPRWTSVGVALETPTLASLEAATRDALDAALADVDGRFALVRLEYQASGKAHELLHELGQAALLERASRQALDLTERMAVEAVRISKVETTTPESGLSADAAAFLRESAADPSVRAGLEEARAEIRAKAGSAIDFDDPRFDLDAILDAARALAQADAGSDLTERDT